MSELFREEEMNQLESVVVANMGDLDSLCDAFRGCHAVFHTSSFIDLHGASGYSVSFLNIRLHYCLMLMPIWEYQWKIENPF